MNIDFTKLVDQKIAERRDGRSTAVEAAAQADERFRVRAAPVAAAVSEMVKGLSKNPMFAHAMGWPEVTWKREDTSGRVGVVSIDGCAGTVSFLIFEHDVIWMRIYPSMIVAQALDSSLVYTIDPIKGDLARIEDMIICAIDHIADFFADIYWSPATHILRSASQGG